MAAKHGRTPLRVFVYKNDVPCIATHTSGARTRFESHLAQLFATGWHRTDMPEKADIFYHPACLVERFWRNREGMRQIDERVTEQILRLGFAHRPHIVNAMRCFGIRQHGDRIEEDYTRHGLGTNALPTLWAQPPQIQGEPRPDARLNRSLFRFCLQAPKPLDRRRSANFPYCNDRATGASMRPARRRSIRVLFVGSMMPKRQLVIAALNKTRGSRVILLTSRRKVNSSVLQLMKDAEFTLCPEGDTPESERIYHSLEHGSIPLVAASFQPPAMANWSEFSARISFDVDTACVKARCAGRVRSACFDRPLRECVGPLRLPSATSQLRLERGVRAHAGDLRCSADSPAFKAYVLRSLEKFVAEARRQELEGQYPQPHRVFRYPESVSTEPPAQRPEFATAPPSTREPRTLYAKRKQRSKTSKTN